MSRDAWRDSATTDVLFPDDLEGPFPGPLAEFHPRDELFLNGEFLAWNIDDAGVHAEVTFQHVYGVVED
jgi:hypothetical protein